MAYKQAVDVVDCLILKYSSVWHEGRCENWEITLKHRIAYNPNKGIILRAYAFLPCLATS